MSLNRILKIVNILVAILLVLVAGLLYWYVYRPLPQVSGKIFAPVSAEAHVRRDRLGVPHIAAASLDDALFLQGYVTAQDRLWQMDLLRRVGAGALSEVFGRAAIELDRDYARLGMRRIAQEYERKLNSRDRALFAAYARGVNYFIETHRRNLPIEFTLLGYDPRPWRVEDSLVIALHMFRILTHGWRDELLKRNMLAAGDPEKVSLLFPSRTGGEIHIGSNAWALAGFRTSMGRPIVANDPHLEWSHPSIWYLTHLQAPGLNVSGAAMPGLPAILIGHNARIAWGVTVLHFDVQDLYAENLDPQSGRYEFRGQPEQANPDRQIIAVKGEAPEELLTWVTRHGPVIVTEAGTSMALRWSAAETGLEYSFFDLNRASNWDQFNAALSRFPGPGMNFVYGDVDGNIGFHVAGKLPVRRNHAGDLPVDGPSGTFEWDGFIPYEQLPSSYNPPSGVVVTSNQNPFPDPYPFPVNGNFDSHYRSSQILARLNSQAKWDVASQLGIQTDVYSALSHFLVKQTVAAWDRRKPRNPALVEPVRLMRGWNGQMEREEPVALLATLLYQHIRRGIVDRAAPGKALAYDNRMGAAVIEKVLRERPSGWFPDYDQFLIQSLADAVEEGDRLQGRVVNRWNYGRYLELRIPHPVLSRIPYIGQYFTIGPVPMSGASTTVKQTTLRLGPSMRMVVSPGDWDASLLNLSIGQSGQPLSGHFDDQWDAYYAGRSFPMQFEKIEANSVLTFQPGRE